MAEPDSQGVSVMFFIGYGRTLLEELNENILVIVEIHEVGTTLLVMWAFLERTYHCCH